MSTSKHSIAGNVFNSVRKEVEVGATIRLKTKLGQELASVETDESGDFRFPEVDPGKYVVEIISRDYQPAAVKADAKDGDVMLEPFDLATLPLKMNNEARNF